MRTWMLAEALIECGHNVTWWSSTFSHQRKTLLAQEDADVCVNSKFCVRMLHAGQYKKNVSLSRVLHHIRLGHGFAKAAVKYPKPDVIVCAYPIIDLAKEVAAYANARNIPLIIDVRDQWPTTFLIVCPAWLKPLVWLHVYYLKHVVKRIFLSATRLVAMSQGCLLWAQNIAKKENLHDRIFYIGFSQRQVEISNESLGKGIRELCTRLKGKLVFLYAGSFGAFYELPLVVQVARRCQNDSLTDVHFVLAGDGDQLESLKILAEGLSNISFPGWLNSDEMHQLLKASHVGMLPYYDFGDGTFPNKPAEYFAYGLPVISSIEGELAKILSQEEIGINYRCGDEAGLYHAIKIMRENETMRKQWSNNALRVFSEQFDARAIYIRYAGYIEDVARAIL